MKKILVTGASGFLGWNLCQIAQKNWQVFGTYLSNVVKIPGATIYQSDLTDFNTVEQLFKNIRPDAVIHTAAASKPNYCETHREESYAINVTASINIARLCGEYQIPCAFTSTDLVFDGKNPVYQESDRVSPICYYGEQKVIAEEKMSEIYSAIALCRMPLMFGLASPVAASFIQGMISNLQAGKEINLFIDEFRTPASAPTAANGLLLAIEKQVQGILHLGGKERISRYDFGLLLGDIWQLPTELIKPCKQADVAMVAPRLGVAHASRSPDTSLDSSKAFALGYQPLSLKAELRAIKNHQ